MKAREVYEKLNGKVDPEVMKVLVSLAERLSVQQQEIDALGMAFSRLTQLTCTMVDAGANMKKKLDRMRGDPDDKEPAGRTKPPV